MTPQTAARRFISLVLHSSFRDVLELTDPLGVENEANQKGQKEAYTEVEKAIRQRFQTRHDLDELGNDVVYAVPEEHQAAVARALEKLTDAVTDEMTVKQQAGYVVGIALGRAVHPSIARTLGAGWQAPAKDELKAALGRDHHRQDG